MLRGEHFQSLCHLSCRKKQLTLRHAYLCTKWSARECWRPSLAASAQGRNLLSFMPMEGGEQNVATKLSSFSPVWLDLHRIRVHTAWKADRFRKCYWRKFRQSENVERKTVILTLIPASTGNHKFCVNSFNLFMNILSTLLYHIGSYKEQNKICTWVCLKTLVFHCGAFGHQVRGDVLRQSLMPPL